MASFQGHQGSVEEAVGTRLTRILGVDVDRQVGTATYLLFEFDSVWHRVFFDVGVLFVHPDEQGWDRGGGEEVVAPLGWEVDRVIVGFKVVVGRATVAFDGGGRLELRELPEGRGVEMSVDP